MSTTEVYTPAEHNRMTSTDVWLINNSEEILGLIDECVKVIPELQHISASPTTKTQYKALVQTALPNVSFRIGNEGRVQERTTLGTVETVLKFLDASWSIDEAIAQECEWGVDAALAIQAKAHLQAALQKIAVQTWYGTTADATGFVGINSLLKYKNSPMTVDAGGTGDGATSIYAIRTDIDAVQYAWGQNGKISDGAIIYNEQYDSQMRKFWGYAQPITGYVGLQIPTYQCIGRICNITEQTGKMATDRLVGKLLAMFPASKKPTMLFMSQRSQEQIRDSRTAYNPTGAEAPYPETIFNIPLYVSEAISDNEEIAVAAPITP